MNILSQFTNSQTNVPPAYVRNTLGNKGLKAPTSTTKTSIFYINDLHGQIPKMQRLASASMQLGVAAKNAGSDYLKVCAGDTFIGSDYKRNLAASKFLDIAGIQAKALGNHEFDITASICGDLLKNSKTKILGMNMNFPDSSSHLKSKVLRSTIVEGDSGEKYGIIGVQPSDINQRMKKKEVLEGITIDDIEETIDELEDEIEELEEKDVNKIILLSHEGYSVEKQIGESVSGIDVIIGGHSHDLIEGVQPGKNLVYSPAGEPVIITQAGRDGNHFGVLNLEFNDKGQITYVQNNVADTNLFNPHLMMTKTIDNILGVSPVIGNLRHVDTIPKNNLIEENPWADFVADAIKTRLNADVVLINAANFRGSVDRGTVTERDITSIFPFNNKLFKVKLSEKDMVDAIKLCGKSLTSKNSKPGLMQVSGLSYTMDANGELKSLSYIDKQGNRNEIDVNNPNPNKIYTAVYDEFLVGGGDNLSMLKCGDDKIIERYPFDKDKVTIDYIKTMAQPFDVRKDGRITVLK